MVENFVAAEFGNSLICEAADLEIELIREPARML